MGAALQGVSTPAVLSASSRFRNFKPEHEQNIRVSKVESNPVVEKMKKVWAECGFFSYSIGWQKSCNRIFEKISGIECSAEDIKTFCVVLVQFQDEEEFATKTGLFLSALINNSKDAEFVIYTTHFIEPIHYLGHCNTKNITVEGDGGYAIGNEMKSGSITVKGDAGDFVGNAMEDGIISVEGNSGKQVGIAMTGGEIHLHKNGDISGHARNGRIFRREEQIFPK